jgi:hypothetical protein
MRLTASGDVLTGNVSSTRLKSCACEETVCVVLMFTGRIGYWYVTRGGRQNFQSSVISLLLLLF